MVLLSLTSFSLARGTLVLEVKGTITQDGSPVEGQYQVIISNLSQEENCEIPGCATVTTETPSPAGTGTYKNGWFNLFNPVADNGDQIQVEVKSAEGQKLVSKTATYSSGTSMTIDLILESEPTDVIAPEFAVSGILSGLAGSEVVAVTVGDIVDKGIQHGVGGEAIAVTVTDSANVTATGSGTVAAKAAGDTVADVVIGGITVSSLKYGQLTITATVTDGASNVGDGVGVGGDGDGTAGTQALAAVAFESESAWSTSLTATSKNQQVAPQTVVFGFDPSGSSGFDSNLDQSAPPAPNVPVFLDLYFPVDAGFITRLSKNIIALSAGLEYTFHLRSDTDAIDLSWDMITFPDTFTSVLLQETASGTSVNMRNQATTTYAKGTYIFKIILQSTISIEIDLQPGWNMISIPGTPSDTSPESLKPGTGSQILLPLYRWNPSRFTYEAVSELKSGEGYWLLTIAPKGETISITLNPTFSQTLSLSAGWNMIGGLATTVSFTDPQETPDEAILPPAYSWDAARFTYASASELKASLGYWVLSMQPCQLFLSSTDASGAPSLLARQPEGLFDLQISTSLWQKRLSIGWHRNSDQNQPINELDVALPPISPNSTQQNQAHFLHAGCQLQQDTQALSTNSSWQLELQLTDNSQLSWQANQLPTGMSMLMDNIDLRKIDQTILPAGQHLLSFRLVPIVELPTNSSVEQNYPNPFNPETWIPYQLHQASEVSLSIYSSDGTLVRQIDLGHQPAGHYQAREKAVYWDGRNQAGEVVSSGVYFYQLTAGDYRQMRKMVVLK